MLLFLKRLLPLALGITALTTTVVLAKNHAGDVFSLDIWKLTIPMDDDGDGVADEVTQPTLRLFEDPDFFFLSEKKDSIVFRTPAGGATTKTSSYPRSELREMKKGGTEKVSWGTNDGKIHNLTVEVAINAIPPKKPHVVCVQIHDSEDDLLMVRLEGKKLFLERNGAEDVMLNDEYELGSFFNLMIIADNGRIRALYEGKQIMEWKIEKDEIYFKAGCYLQSNTEKGDQPDAFGEVEIRKLFVTHK
ncbi:MAG: polysaccharide lyase family 7 protein [Verrucomicrobiales bacterium]|nr:polysaccharide lyase family 7 protein [Verrucomicrobiales bacterium]